MSFWNKRVSYPPGILVSFYLGKHPDDKGRYINEIHSWNYDQLEYIHDYIQWLFPLKEMSGANPRAPVLDEAQINEFRSNAALRTQMIKSFKIMLSFYGLQIEANDKAIRLSRSPEYSERRLVWLTYRNHNYLRITRILTSLCLLGLEEYALAFLNVLDQIYKEEKGKIGGATYTYWAQAIERVRL